MASRYAAVIFDLFGTLVPAYRHHGVPAEMARLLGLDPRRFIPLFALETREAREKGELPLRENLRRICHHLGLLASGARIDAAVAVRREFTRAALSPRGDALNPDFPDEVAKYA